MSDLIIIMGPTGAGKSTQAEHLLKRHPGWVHLSSGYLLRRDPAMAKALADGSLAPDDVVDRIVNEAFKANRDAPMIILDGFPRTVEQIPWLEAAMKRYDLNLRAVVKLTVSKEQAATRLAWRHRADDNVPSIDAKWDWYHKQTLPVINHFEKLGLVLHCDGADSVEEVGRTIDEALHV